MEMLILLFKSGIPREEVTKVSESRAERYRKVKGLIQKFYVEDKANGPAVINDLSSVIPNLIGKSPGMESKVERASIVSAAHAVPMSAQCEAGHIYLPHPHLYPWVLEFIEEFSFFPNGSFDDMVDMSTQAINFWNVNDGDLGLYTMSQYNEEMGNNDKKDPFCTEVVHV